MLTQPIGHVSSLHRYPVKSMLGEDLTTAFLDERGIAGDRTHAVVDAQSGKVASAKRPQLWAGLLQCAAQSCGGADNVGHGVRITLPDGGTVASGDRRTDEILSRILQRPVRLEAQPPENAEVERSRPDEVLAQGRQATVTSDATKLGRASPPGTFFDYAPIHLITSASLEAIGAAAAIGIEAMRYRPNIIVHTPGAQPFVENEWVNNVIQLGDTVRLRIIVQTPRCAVPTLPHGDLANRPEALRTLMTINRVPIPGIGALPCAGVYAQVLVGGTIRCADPVHFVPA